MRKKIVSQAGGVVILGWMLACSAAGPAGAAAPRPNIILCMTDDQGWGDTSYNGLKQIQTPNLDAMAAAGLRFNRFYAQHPSCSPTRASVMTGRHPYRMGTYWPGMPLRRQEMTIAQAVKRAGYTTGHFGKWHLSGGKPGGGRALSADDPLNPGQFGFDEWFTVSNWFDLDWTFSHKGTPVKVAGDGSDAIVAQALKFIAQQAHSHAPFLACIHYGSPHVPLKPLPSDLKAAHGAPYYGEILGVDRSLGALRAGLRKLGIADNTLVWFNSDNGAWVDAKAAPDTYGWNGGLRGHKGELWEGGIRVPGIIEWPGHVQPAITDVIGCTSDIYPTVVDLLQIKIPDQILPLDGISLVPLLEGKMTARPQPLGFWHHGDERLEDGPAAWLENRFKLIQFNKPEQVMLFDLIADPHETTDVAAQHPADVARMLAALEAWKASVMRSYNGKDYPGGKVLPPPKGI